MHQDGARRERPQRIAVEIAVAALGVGLLACAMAADRAWLQRHVLPDFFLSLSAQTAVLNAIRVAAAGLGLALLILARPRLGRRVATTPVRRLAAQIAPTVLAVVLALGVSEVVLRRVPWLGAADALFHPEPLRRRDDRLGWVFIPARTGRDRVGGREVDYVIDPAGYRVPSPDRPVDPAQPTILFTGESIIFGHGLTWAESLPGQVEALTGVQTANLAVEGYATDQAYQRLRTEWPRFQHPVGVVILFMPSLLDRNLDVERPHLAPGLIWRPAARQSRLLAATHRLIPYRSQAEITAGLAMTRQALQATVDLARAKGATPLILVPQLALETAPERDLRLRVLDGLPYVLARTDPAWRIPHDSHPDPRGAHALAEAVAGYLARPPGRN